MQLSPMMAALLPVWLPILAAPLVYLLRRKALAASLLSSAAMAVVAWWLFRDPTTSELEFLGRTLLGGALGQALLVGLALWLIVAFMLAWRVSQGWSLFPFLLIAYGLIAAALLFEELVLRILLLKIAWLVVILLVQGGAEANTRAATRLLILAVLALPPFLVASTLIAQRLFEPEAALTAIIVLALGMGFALMLAIIPFHAWLPQAAEDGPPLIAAWLAAGMGGSYLVILLDLLGRYQWLSTDAQVQRLLFGGGLLLAIGGALLTVTERHLGRLWSYAVLADLGYVLLGLGFGTQPGALAALLVLSSRLLSLLLAGGALATIRHRATTLDFDDLLGVGVRLPISMLGFAVGGMAMLGAPLTAGFPGHWSVLRLMVAEQSGWAAVLVVASILGLIGFVRALAVMTSTADEAQLARVEREPRIATTLLAALLGLSVLIGVAPQTLGGVLSHLLRSLNF